MGSTAPSLLMARLAQVTNGMGAEAESGSSVNSQTSSLPTDESCPIRHAGKTYTMEGGPRDSSDGRHLSAEAGVIPRSIKQIFDTIEGNNSDSTVKVSFLELYNEELTDLLVFEDDKKLRLLEDRSGVVVHGLEEVIVRSATEIYQVLDRGTAKRRTAATLLNNRSSRSHSIFTITIHLRESSPDGEDVIKIGKLNLVDLAGSENISRSGAKDARAREAGALATVALASAPIHFASSRSTAPLPQAVACNSCGPERLPSCPNFTGCVCFSCVLALQALSTRVCSPWGVSSPPWWSTRATSPIVTASSPACCVTRWAAAPRPASLPPSRLLCSAR